MTREYDGNHAMDIGYFDRVEGRSVGKPVAIFHNPLGLPPKPDPEVQLTREELAARISWRKSAGLETEEKEKAKTELDK